MPTEQTALEKQFKAERKLIGEGKMAKVYLWNGFAYKCFRADYPDDWIDYEINVQKIVSSAALPAVKYFPSELPRSIKMEYIDGVTLADRMRKDKYKNGCEDLMSLFPEIHKVKGINLPALNPYMKERIATVNIEDAVKERAYRLMEEIPDGNTLCHFDYHFLNVMYCADGYKIIDWISAKVGNPIYDYARTYVISYEFAYRLSTKIYGMCIEQGGFDENEFRKAAYVAAVHRLSECDYNKVRELLEKLSV